MVPLQIYGPLAKAKTAYEVLEMMSDPKIRKEVMDNLKTVEDERNRLNVAIETFGKAKSIQRLHKNAADKDAQATALLAGAETEAKEIRAKAKTDIDAAREKVRLREVAVDAQEKGLNARDAELTSALDAREAMLAKRDEELTDWAAKTSARIAVLEARERAYLDHKKALVELGAQAKAIPAL